MVEFAPATENLSPLFKNREEMSPSALAGTSRKDFEHTLEDLVNILTEKVKRDREAISDYILLGRVYRLQGDAKRALRLHQNLLAHEISDKKLQLTLYIELGLDLLHEKMDDFGERFLQKALSLEKNHAEALRGLTQVYEIREEYESAAKTLSKLPHASPQEKKWLSFIYAQLAKQRLILGHHVPARRAVEGALRADPTNPYAKLTLSEIYMATTRYDKAIQLLTNFLEEWPTHSFLALRKLEDAHYQKDTFTELEDTLREAIRRQPDNYYVLFSLARHLFKKRRKEEAQEFIRKSLEAHPYYVNAIKEWISLNADESVQQTLKPFLTNFKRSRRFVCPNCETRYKLITWHCSACGTWDVFQIRYELPAP